jgi:hypothetical protein
MFSLVRKLRKRDHLEDLSEDGRRRLNGSLKKWDGGTDWTDLDQDRTGGGLL